MPVSASWYDFPQYFDMVFRDETPGELQFLEAAFQRYATVPVRRLYEPGCGSGRLVIALAAREYDVVALDNHPAMLDYLRRRLRRGHRMAELIEGDMTDYVVSPPVDAAFCTFNTFRHLTTGEAAERHLRSVAESVRPGGIYVLGFHCLPMDVDPDSTERWTARHGGTRVSVTFRVTDFHRRQRLEDIRVSIKATRASGEVTRIRSEFSLRLYTPRQAKTLIAEVADVWELVAIHDFDYQIDIQRKIDRDLIDAVFILRRRAQA